MRRTRDLADRFWSKVAVTSRDECWLWTAAKNRKGYGVIGVGGRASGGGGLMFAHRLAWQLANGAAPVGLVCHRCDVRACVNPRHLFLGTAKDNTADMMKKGRARPQVISGERHGMSIFAAADIVAIRDMYYQRGMTQRSIAERFKCHRSTIGLIVARRTWASVQ